LKNQTWSAIHEIFQELNKLIAQAQGVVTLKDKVEKRGMQVLKKGIQNEEIVPLRAEIRNKLNFLKARLSEHLTEREVYLVLFPVVVYFDEIVQSKIFHGQHTAWPPLQKELYQIDNGGDIFYDLLDDILRKPETIPFVYEIFYFCLSDGFQGKYTENPVKIKEYQDKLQAKIPLPKVKTQEKAEVPHLMRADKSPLWQYVGVILFLACVYVLLYFLASLEL
jgi:type IV/VI secretion system ImpK/VasF family protein